MALAWEEGVLGALLVLLPTAVPGRILVCEWEQTAVATATVCSATIDKGGGS